MTARERSEMTDKITTEYRCITCPKVTYNMLDGKRTHRGTYLMFKCNECIAESEKTIREIFGEG